MAGQVAAPLGAASLARSSVRTSPTGRRSDGRDSASSRKEGVRNGGGAARKGVSAHPLASAQTPGSNGGLLFWVPTALNWGLPRGVATTCWFLQGTQAPGGIRSGLFLPLPLSFCPVFFSKVLLSQDTFTFMTALVANGLVQTGA